jgi:flavin reductase (DIM6/NTAB) family NADH-FMN oxidoreductase RutF
MDMQKHIDYEAIMAMEKQMRVNFINSIGGFKSVCLVGTQNESKQINLAIHSSLVHIGSNPPLYGIVFRPGVVERHTMENILATKYYTINHINETIYRKAHQTSARYPRNISEFEVVQLQSEFKNEFFAPFVKESVVQMAMEFKEKIDLKINNTVLIIGEVKAVYLPVNCLQIDGFLDIEKANSMTCSGLDSYHITQRLERLSYAKPDRELTRIISDYFE